MADIDIKRRRAAIKFLRESREKNLSRNFVCLDFADIRGVTWGDKVFSLDYSVCDLSPAKISRLRDCMFDDQLRIAEDMYSVISGYERSKKKNGWSKKRSKVG